MNSSDQRTTRLVQMGILLAIILLFAFTSIGYLKLGVIEITLMCVPVAVGAIILGPVAGGILGAAFGITSFVQCFGTSAFGVLMLQLNPIACAATCILPRILCGFLAGLVFRAFHGKLIGYYTAAFATAFLNTVFFVGMVLLCFWHNDGFTSQMTAWGMNVNGLWLFVVAFVGVNGVVEAIVNVLVAGTAAKAVQKITKRD